MFCRNCANQLDDRAVACPKCGVNPRDGTAFCQACGQPTLPNAVVCAGCGVPLAKLMAAGDPRARNKIPAGICGILLGCLGIHKFILGYNTAGIIMLLVSVVAPIVTCGFGILGTSVMSILGLVEGIIYLTKSDADFVKTYVDGKREWF
jgi:TM2 domain-containing membrane protein YozV